MATPVPDTCHCLVRHPDKPKFLVVKHEESWSPPVLLFPPGLVDFKVANINQGMLDKYGLKTRMLRPLIHLPNYQCLEMELVSMHAGRNLQAVWVDQAEYLRTRTSRGNVPDPFALWFEEQERGTVPKLRPPFHLPGWFEQAEHWMQFQLDRLGIQATGSVEQFRQGWTSSCLLRVPTNQGWVYFKAGNETAPGESVLTDALAQRWPQWVDRPLAIDAQRNWMLSHDLRSQQQAFDLRQLPAFAGEVAKLQLESRDELSHWESLGCRRYSTDDFIAIAEEPEPYRAILQEGGGRLGPEEWQDLQATLRSVAGDCRTLAGIGLPLTLVHIDFRDDNLALLDGQHLMLDWNSTIISHPFLVLGRIFEDHRSTLAQRQAVGLMRIDESLYQQVIQAYLEPFAGLASAADLQRSIHAAENLDGLWRMLYLLHKVGSIEPATPHYYRQVVGLQQRARRFIKRMQQTSRG
jgi:hypothetical protein